MFWLHGTQCSLQQDTDTAAAAAVSMSARVARSGQQLCALGLFLALTGVYAECGTTRGQDKTTLQYRQPLEREPVPNATVHLTDGEMRKLRRNTLRHPTNAMIHAVQWWTVP